MTSTPATHPPIGWRLNGKLVHTPAAYAYPLGFLDSFRAAFPEKAERMDRYSFDRGWGEATARAKWAQAVLHYLDKNAERV